MIFAKRRASKWLWTDISRWAQIARSILQCYYMPVQNEVWTDKCRCCEKMSVNNFLHSKNEWQLMFIKVDHTESSTPNNIHFRACNFLCQILFGFLFCNVLLLCSGDFQLSSIAVHISFYGIWQYKWIQRNKMTLKLVRYW